MLRKVVAAILGLLGALAFFVVAAADVASPVWRFPRDEDQNHSRFEDVIVEWGDIVDTDPTGFRWVTGGWAVFFDWSSSGVNEVQVRIMPERVIPDFGANGQAETWQVTGIREDGGGFCVDFTFAETFNTTSFDWVFNTVVRDFCGIAVHWQVFTNQDDWQTPLYVEFEVHNAPGPTPFPTATPGPTSTPGPTPTPDPLLCPFEPFFGIQQNWAVFDGPVLLPVFVVPPPGAVEVNLGFDGTKEILFNGLESGFTCFDGFWCDFTVPLETTNEFFCIQVPCIWEVAQYRPARCGFDTLPVFEASAFGVGVVWSDGTLTCFIGTLQEVFDAGVGFILDFLELGDSIDFGGFSWRICFQEKVLDSVALGTFNLLPFINALLSALGVVVIAWMIRR